MARISGSERFVICHNPEAAERDAQLRAQLLAQLTGLIDGSDALSEFKRGELRGKIALGYEQLLEVERGWRDMKQIIDLRLVYHRFEERIRAHVILCWLALLLMRIIETTTGGTWPACRRELERLNLGTFTGLAGLFRQVTALTKPQQDLLAKLATTAR